MQLGKQKPIKDIKTYCFVLLFFLVYKMYKQFDIFILYENTCELYKYSHLFTINFFNFILTIIL